MGSIMLRVTPGIIVLLGLIVTDQTLAQDRVQQELNRVGELLQQLDRTNSRQKTNVAESENRKENTPNPFASRNAAADPDSKAPPEVSIDEREIRIEVAGQVLRINRPGTQPNDSTAQSAPALEIEGNRLQSLNETGLERAKIYQQYSLSLAEFGKRDYEKAESLLAELGDSIVNEDAVCQTYALILFQTGDFQKAAEWAYAGLQSVKPFDWNTIQGLYGHPEDYAARYRELQKLSREEPERVELHFLLAYHHLMLGHLRHAEAELKITQNSLGSDLVVQKLLQMAQNPAAEPPQPLSD